MNAPTPFWGGEDGLAGWIGDGDADGAGRKRRGSGAYSVGGHGPNALNGHYNGSDSIQDLIMKYGEWIGVVPVNYSRYQSPESKVEAWPSYLIRSNYY
jgi:hypothetical protein